jgi:hypothetical protein
MAPESAAGPPLLVEGVLSEAEFAEKGVLLAELCDDLGVDADAAGDGVYELAVGVPAPFVADGTVVAVGDYRTVRWTPRELSLDTLRLLLRRNASTAAADRAALRVYRRPLTGRVTALELRSWWWADELCRVARLGPRKHRGTKRPSRHVVAAALEALRAADPAGHRYPAAPPMRAPVLPVPASAAAAVVSAVEPAAVAPPAGGIVVPAASAAITPRDVRALSTIAAQRVADAAAAGPPDETVRLRAVMTALTCRAVLDASAGDTLRWRAWDAAAAATVHGVSVSAAPVRADDGLHLRVRVGEGGDAADFPAAGLLLLHVARDAAAGAGDDDAAPLRAVPLSAVRRGSPVARAVPAVARRPLGADSRRTGDVRRAATPPAPRRAVDVVYVPPRAVAPPGTLQIAPRGGPGGWVAPVLPPPPPPGTGPPPDAPADAPAADAPSAFRQGYGSPLPAVTTLKGEFLQGLTLRAPGTKLFEAGLTRGTRRGHRRMLRRLSSEMPTEFLDLPLSMAILSTLEEVHRRHTGATLLRAMGCAMGALSRLSAYSLLPGDLSLGRCQYWRDSMTTVQNSSRGRARVPVPFTPAQFQQLATDPATSLEMRTIVILTWCTAGRGGDIAKLETRQARLEADGTLFLRYSIGKGQLLKGVPDSLTIKLLPAFLPTVAAWITERLAVVERDPWLFSDPQNESHHRALMRRFLAAIRSVAPTGEQKSLRHGAVQALCRGEATMEDMRAFTFHTDGPATQRYLQDHAPLRARTMELAAALQQPPAASA